MRRCVSSRYRADDLTVLSPCYAVAMLWLNVTQRILNASAVLQRWFSADRLRLNPNITYQ